MPDNPARSAQAATDLWSDVERSGYYPELMADALRAAIGSDDILAHVVHQETTIDDDMGIRRHVTVLVATPARLVVCHTDEHPPAEGHPYPHATTTTEVVPISRITSVALTTTVANPAAYVPGAACREATLVIGWGAVGHLDLEPASCGDENCEADHGYTGTMSADDLSLRVSEDGDGPAVVAQVLHFAGVVSEAASRART
ncbi:conserved hypothetical protein [Acidothermus cellulolyticus 11B]|jgi:hypothetical protein|uniref:Phosphodiesterase n=1 Tax=Acidothermus cellulolyticus (strain ATCC 43068 / DSM 8971 / 11B) TaxID=351607 RepID=A0LUT1_ACIC1|nr:DUF5998 family protein [Acidothermus cellulolyticus]ABK53191.1 conserved hypothetical protein [Acidothermus cellulolyticus 11B]MBX5447823.1 phosphodiesterase [Acidothermus cellulolyticus]